MKGQAAFRLLPSVRGAVVTWRCLSFLHSLLHAFIHLMNIGEGLSCHVLMITMMAGASLYSFLCVSGCCSVVKLSFRPGGLQHARLLCPKFMSAESVMSSNRLILCHPLFLLPSIFPSNQSLFQ